MAKCLSCAVDHYGMAKGVPTVIGNYVMSAAERMMVDMFLPVSHAVAEGTGLIGSRLPFQVIPNFVPDDFGIIEGEADEHLAGLPEEDYLLFVGDVGSEKGLNVLLEAYGGLIDAPPLVLIGRTFDDQQNAFPPNITVLKSLPHRAVMHAWRRSLAVLVPSIWPEPFGLVVIEAMSSGSPVIASRIGGLSDIVVDGVTGLLVTPHDPDDLRKAIQTLLADPELRARLGQAGKQRVAEFRSSAVLPRVEAVYQMMIDSRRFKRKTGRHGPEQSYYNVEETQIDVR
jgi:glycosyltransferase involved in cell wall biosynthesis